MIQQLLTVGSRYHLFIVTQINPGQLVVIRNKSFFGQRRLVRFYDQFVHKPRCRNLTGLGNSKTLRTQVDFFERFVKFFNKFVLQSTRGRKLDKGPARDLSSFNKLLYNPLHGRNLTKSEIRQSPDLY